MTEENKAVRITIEFDGTTEIREARSVKMILFREGGGEGFIVGEVSPFETMNHLMATVTSTILTLKQMDIPLKQQQSMIETAIAQGQLRAQQQYDDHLKKEGTH